VTPGQLHVAICLVLLTFTGGCAEPHHDAASWSELEARLPQLPPSERATAIERFVADHQGTPVIEDDSRLIFFVRGESDTPPRVVGDFNGWAAIPGGVDPAVGVMARVDGTPWWWLLGSADADARIEYVVIEDDVPRADSLNPRRVNSNGQTISEVRMPGWVPQPELDDVKAVPAGVLTEERFDSRALGGSRRVWTYLPPEYRSNGEPRYPSVYVLDGGIYVERMDVPRILDRLVGAGAIPPLVAVFVAPDDRLEEYTKSEGWMTFMAAELVPAIDARLRTSRAAADRVILGSSLGAVGATRLALARPDAFGRIAAIAPPAGAAEALAAARQAMDSTRRWFVMGGRFDALLADARRLTAQLTEAGESVTYLEVPEGHSAETFRGHLDDALRALVGVGRNSS